MKKFIRVSYMVIFILIMLQGFVFADEFYTITDYDVEIDVTQNNVYHISETISVLFKEPRHGIYRDIPTRYYGYSHDITDIKVYNPQLGMVYNYDVSNKGSGIEIKIGDADIFVEGSQIYRIDYTYDGSDDLINEYDEFYFNLIGNEWNTTIDHVDFKVTMPKAFDSNRLNITAGAYNSTSSEGVEWTVNGNTISGSAENLSPYEGITLALNLDEGYYVDVSKPYSKIWIYLLMGILVILFGVALWIRTSNYRRNKIIPVLNFYPPRELNPAEIAYVFNEEHLVNTDMASIIIYWASKGYLKIYEEEKTGLFGRESLYFERIKDGGDMNNQYEKGLFNDLFSHGSGNIVRIEDLERVFYEELNIARSFVRDNYRGQFEILENKFQYGIIAVSFLVLLMTTAILAIYIKVLIGVPYFGAIIPTFIFLLIFWIGAMIIATKKKGKSKRYKMLGVFKYAFMIFLVTRFFTIIRSVIADFDFSSIEFGALGIQMVIVIVLFIITIFTIGKIKRYTPFARDLLDNIYGFRDFLETAKIDKLEMLFEENPDYFYDMLPYAMVLGLTKIWDKKMESLTLDGPDWYVSSRPFNSYYMMSMMNRSFTQMSSQPQSSSSSAGGGSVGGGGGGGGGGSW